MDTEQTAKQLELAAQILRTGHPWHLYKSGILHDTKPLFSPCNWIGRIDAEFEIRLALATPPDNRPLHNPDNLNAEQVGAGYRLVLAGESCNPHAELWNEFDTAWFRIEVASGPYELTVTYRLPLSTPWPKVEKPDPYAELKAAHKAGKVIQYTDDNIYKGTWKDCVCPMWVIADRWHINARYRIKPEPREVDLGPEDVPPNSALRLATWDAGVHVMPSVWRSGVSFAIRENVDQQTYANLRRDGWLINRPRHRDADGNPTLWEPCSKKVEG